jgi:alanyl-tRNA synthetase
MWQTDSPRMTTRLYFTDARTLAFDATLVAVETWESKPAALLDATYFFPTSGGQPHDLGSLGGARVVDVVERGEDILHVLEAPLAGRAGERIRGEIDAMRRLDFMRQHTGQHVLSQAFRRVVVAETVSVHFGDEICTLDLARTSLSGEERDRVSALANAVVMDDRPIRVHLLSPGEATSRFALRRAPLEEAVVRVVEIDDFDASACCGTHASRTGEIGPIAILGWERGKAGHTRVTFVCGERAVRATDRKTDVLARLVALHMAPESELVAASTRDKERIRSLEKERAQLRGERLAAVARSLVDAAPVVAGAKLVCGVPDGVEPAELPALVREIAALGPAVVCVGAAGAGAAVHVAAPEGSQVDARVALKAALDVVEGRGGGKPTQAQGAGPRVERLGEAVAAAERAARAALDAP